MPRNRSASPRAWRATVWMRLALSLTVYIILTVLISGALLPATAATLHAAQSPVGDFDFARTDIRVQGLGPRGIIADDLNGDEIPDLVVANLGTYQIYQSQTLDVLFGKGDGTFELVQTIPAGDINQPYGIAAADLRNIDRWDIIVPNKDGRTVSVYLQEGDGTFAEPKVYDANDAWAVSAGDINGDGYQDLAVSNFDGFAVTLLLGVGDGTFLQSEKIASVAGMQPRAVEFGDFNKDGRLDMVVPSDTLNGRLAIYFNTGSLNRVAFDTPRIINVGQLTGAAVIHDLNHDGNDDIVATSLYSNHLSVLLGKGDGTFSSPSSYGTGDVWPFGVALTDFNGDGTVDAVLTGVKGPTCSVLPGDGRGGFGSAHHFQVEGPSRWLVAADFDRDGRTDLALGNYTFSGNFETDPGRFFNTVSVMMNRLKFTPAHPTIFRVDCGGSAAATLRGLNYSADGNFDGGSVIVTETPIANTDSQALFQSARQGTFTYTARVAPGRSYTVKLLIAELSQKFAKKRAMNITANGKTLVKGFKITQRAPLNTALTLYRRNIWPDRDGYIRLEFSGKKGGAICSGIAIY